MVVIGCGWGVGEGASGVTEVREADKNPTVHSISPSLKSYPAPNVNSVKLEELWVEG